jgi:RNA polymerase sigma-70 factor (ECF subfamily)
MEPTIADIEQLYRRRYGEFLRVALELTGDQGLAADVVQDAFVRAIVNRSKFRGDASLETWVWRIVINAAHSSRPRRQLAVLEEAPETPEPDDDTDPAGFDGWLDALSERERLVVFLRYVADLEYRSIAAALDVKVGTVSATLHTAHQSLRCLLEEAPRP